jgi:hypothetical protein
MTQVLLMKLSRLLNVWTRKHALNRRSGARFHKGAYASNAQETHRRGVLNRNDFRMPVCDSEDTRMEKRSKLA